MNWWRRVRRLTTGLLFVVSFGLQSLSLADQSAPELSALFEQLRVAEEGSEAAALEQAIWAHWLTGPDKASDQMMLQIQSALQLGRHELGLVLCNQLVDAYPDYAEAWNKRATLLYLLKRHEESVVDIRTTLELEPNHFGALSGLGLILLSAGDAEGALHAFEEVLSINPLSKSAELNAARARAKIGTDI